MKKLIFLMVALTLTLSIAPAKASNRIAEKILEALQATSTPAPEAPSPKWICEVCGVRNSGNYCTNCGFAKPSATQEQLKANSSLFLNANDRYLLEWNGFTVEVLNIEQKLFSDNSAYLHFYTRCVNRSGHNLNMYIDQATVNGVPVDDQSPGIVYAGKRFTAAPREMQDGVSGWFYPA